MTEILKREDGSRVKVIMNLGYASDNLHVRVLFCAARKRVFVDVVEKERDRWDYRRLSPKDKAVYIQHKMLEYVSIEELDKIKQQLLVELGKTITYNFGF